VFGFAIEERSLPEFQSTLNIVRAEKVFSADHGFRERKAAKVPHG
jgi:hypothetical protein